MLDTVGAVPHGDGGVRRDEEPRGVVLPPGHRERARRSSRSQFKPKMVKRTEKDLAKARTKDSMTAFSKLTQSSTGRRGSSTSRR